MTTAMRPLAFIAAMAVVLAGDIALAQTPNAPASTAANTTPAVPEQADESAWSLSALAYTYFLPDSHFVQPTVRADRGWLHLETRYNYEARDTASAWLGYNFSVGTTVVWELTPMLGGVFGDTTGIAPGFEGSLSWRKLELYGESEYVVDTGNRADSFFYNWSELTLAPVNWFRFGVAVQRTRVYQSDRDIQRGVMAGFSSRHVTLTAYVFNPDEDKPRFVLAVELHF